MLTPEEIATISHCLSNPTRFAIIGWLKQPEKHFPANCTGVPNGVGVCMGLIADKAGLSTSTVSLYLSKMVSAGRMSSQRIGKWTYYRLEPERLKAYGDAVVNFGLD